MHIYQWVTEKFPTYSPGRDKWEAAFTVCKPGTYVLVSNGGATDLKAHMDTKKHKAVRGESTSIKLTEFFVRPGKSEDALLKKAFPVSDTAKKFNSARTKTEAIVNDVLAPHSV